MAIALGRANGSTFLSARHVPLADDSISRPAYKHAMRSILSLSAMLAACTPSPQEAVAMHSPDPSPVSAPGSTVGSIDDGTEDPTSRSHRSANQIAGGHRQAAQAPMPESMSAAENPAPVPRADSPAEKRGRKTLSTAFVLVGADGYLTVELVDGRMFVLRDVILNPRDFCGVSMQGVVPGNRYCGSYADVLAARPGGASAPQVPDLTSALPRGEHIATS